MDHEVAPRLVELDTLLEEMSGPERASLWTDGALRHADEWRLVRQKARSLMKVAREAPPRIP